MKVQKIPVVLTRKEVERLIEVAEKDIKISRTEHQKFNAVRNAALLRLAFSTGLRVQELCNLNIDSLFPEEKTLKVRLGKFGNEEYQPFKKPETWKALEGYIPLREKVDGKGVALFISFYGQRILARQINRYLKDYAKRARISKSVHSHILRHSAATELLRKCGNLAMVQKFLRHKNIASTAIYCHIVKDDLVAELVKANL